MAAKDSWLKERARNVYSQSGEDGLLEAIFGVLEIERGYAVELGAHDGVYLSNTRHLFERGWSGLLIEADPARFRQLQHNMRGFGEVKCVKALVSFEGDHSLDELLAHHGAPTDLDLLSIDIDGNDYHLWDSVRRFAPKVVVIEYNPSIPNDVEFVQPRDLSVFQGTSLRSLVKLGRDKGYELGAVTETNGIFVRRDLADKLEIPDNSIEALRAPSPFATSIFQLYDGTIKIGGNDRLIWYNLPIDVARLQIVPSILRRGYPPTQTGAKRLLRYAWVLYYLARQPSQWPTLWQKIRTRLGPRSES
jgi:hypothetical protein